MKQTTVVFAVLFISVLLVSGAAAKRPEDPLLFTLNIEDINYGDMEVMGPGSHPCYPDTWKHAKIRGFTASGTFTFFPSGDYEGPTDGEFFYTENININPDQADCDDPLNDPLNCEPFSTEQGDMVLTFGLDDTIPKSTIQVRFVGQAKLIFHDICADPPVVEVTVINQPWNITGGTGIFSGVHGNGIRSTCGWGCVNYYGEIRP